MREHDDIGAAPPRRHSRRFDDEQPDFLRRRRPRRIGAASDHPDGPCDGDRWPSWDLSAAGDKGPQPHPDWLVTELAAVDVELGVLKSGKEADVHLVQRSVPGTGRSCLLAAKRYRSAEHRLFHRDAGYLEGRRVRRSRENRAMARRTNFGKQVIADQWARAEFGALCRLWSIGAEVGSITVPYPVQLLGTEVLLEFVGDTATGAAAPRLAALRPGPAELAELWRQVVDVLVVLARAQVAHGDLSAYNMLVRDGQIVVIDPPQIVDVVANPNGPAFLARDVHNVSAWFAARGRSDVDTEALTRELLREAGIR